MNENVVIGYWLMMKRILSNSLESITRLTPEVGKSDMWMIIVSTLAEYRGRTYSRTSSKITCTSSLYDQSLMMILFYQCKECTDFVDCTEHMLR